MPEPPYIAYQGFICSDVIFRRTNGLRPDASFVKFSAPSNVKGIQPRLGGGMESVRKDAFVQPGWIAQYGTLLMRESPLDVEREVKVERLYVTSIREQNAADRVDGVKTFRVGLVDERVFYRRGFTDRWRWNLDAAEPPKSLRDIVDYLASRLWNSPQVNRTPRSWDDIYPPYEFERMGPPADALERILSDYGAVVSLGYTNKLSFWLKGEGDVGYGMNSNALRLDRKFIEYDGGDGHVRGLEYTYAPQQILVAGGERIATVAIDRWEPVVLVDGHPIPLMRALTLFLRSGEQSVTGNTVYDELSDEVANLKVRIAGQVSAGEKPDVALVTTLANAEDRLERAHNASLDAIDDLPEPNSSEVDWLLRFVTRPDAFQVHPTLSEKELSVLRRDAFKLWRLPGADSFNQHLLPLLPRAERGGPRLARLPITVSAYRFKKVSTRNYSSPNAVGIGDARLELMQLEGLLSTLRYQIQTRLGGFANPNAEQSGLGWRFGFKTSGEVEDERYAETFTGKVTPATYFSDPAKLIYRGTVNKVIGLWFSGLISDDPIETIVGNKRVGKAFLARPLVDASLRQLYSEAVRRGRSSVRPLIEAELAEVPELAGAYKSTLAKYEALRATLEPSWTGALERQVAEEAYNVGVALSENKPVDVGGLESNLKQIRDIRRAAREQELFGFKPDGSIRRHETFLMVNSAVREHDAAATVEDGRLGLIRTSYVVGLLREDGVPSVDTGNGLSRGPGPDHSWPVLVKFGTRAAPRRRDVPVPTGTEFQRAVSGPNGAMFNDTTNLSRIPPQVAEVEASEDPTLGYYHAAFLARRPPPRADDEPGEVRVERVDLADLTPTRTTTIRRDKWVELIELTGDSNVADLDREASKLAVEVASLNDVVGSDRILYMRPWRVNTNGKVSGVEIKARSGLLGFHTLVVTGFTSAPFVSGNKTSERPARPGLRASPYVEDPEFDG